MIAKDESDRALAHAPKNARSRPANAPSARRSEAGAFGPALSALALAPRCLPRLDLDWDSTSSPERQRQCGGRRHMARTAIVARQRMYAAWFAARLLPQRMSSCAPLHLPTEKVAWAQHRNQVAFRGCAHCKGRSGGKERGATATTLHPPSTPLSQQTDRDVLKAAKRSNKSGAPAK